MATADELLATTEETHDEILVVDLNTRLITIPASLKILGVESDDDVKRLQFSIPRYYGEFDLSTFKFSVNFENAKGNGDLWPVDDLSVSDSDNTMSFSWLVDRSAFKSEGNVTFSICMKLYGDDGIVIKELNTTTASLPVLPGLETSKEVVENNPSAFDAVLFRLYAVEAATGNSQNGYYTIATVNETDTGVEVTLVGSDGEHVATVRHGNDGYSPVKGTDYWTEEDKNEIKSYVNNWSPIAKTLTIPADAWSNSQADVDVGFQIIDGWLILVESPLDSDTHEEYVDSNVKLYSHANTILTFKCDTVPSNDLTVNVVFWRSVNDGDAS